MLAAALETAEARSFREFSRAWLEENKPTSGLKDASSIQTPEQFAVAVAWARALHAAKLVGVTWSERYGGRGAGLVEQIILGEELVRVDAPSHVNVIGTDIAGPTILDHGTEEQRLRYLPRILSADEIWCQGFSEPDAGSDLAAIRTRAELAGDVYVVNGQKVWSSYAHVADLCIALTRTEATERPHDGLTMMVLDMKHPGVEVRPLRQMTGRRQFSEIFFTDVEVPVDAVVGGPGLGWKVAMTTLTHERALLGFRLAARASRLLERVRRLAQTEGIAGEAPLSDPFVRDRLAQAIIELEAVRIFNYRSLPAVLASGPSAEQSVAKLQWSESNQQLTDLAFELVLGWAPFGVGDSVDEWEYEVLRARGNSIESGTSQVLRNIIAQRLLGLPRAS